uniref:Uncharacterized protein n=1 Tax=Haplochromis burtoni TaxID=8153 RepID=A0A3Q3CP71_HAPBU
FHRNMPNSFFLMELDVLITSRWPLFSISPGNEEEMNSRSATLGLTNEGSLPNVDQLCTVIIYLILFSVYCMMDGFIKGKTDESFRAHKTFRREGNAICFARDIMCISLKSCPPYWT